MGLGRRAFLQKEEKVQVFEARVQCSAFQRYGEVRVDLMAEERIGDEVQLEKLILLNCISFTDHKISHLTVVFSIFTRLSNHHHHLKNIFILPQKQKRQKPQTVYNLAVTAHFHLPSP